MKLHVDDSTKISALQEQFTGTFPYLRIEFFEKPHKAGEMSPMGEVIAADTLIGDCRKVHDEGDLTITKDTRVVDLETDFQKKYGLSAQVLRKSGEIWLETSATDEWTLEEQNEQGEFMEKDIND